MSRLSSLNFIGNLPFLLTALTSLTLIWSPVTSLRSMNSGIRLAGVTCKSTVGSANLDWPNLGFEYRETDCFVKSEYKDGKWGPCSVEKDPFIKIHIGATALHYGQACFEGLKAFQTKDGKVCVFRPTENAERIARSSERICMPRIPEEMFLDAVRYV